MLNKLKKLPDAPGVYFFKRGRKILYIGKATSLRSRVRSYFDGRILASRGEKIAAMVEQVSAVDYRLTDSILEALLLEIELINQHRPYYNTVTRDPGDMYYVLVTREAWPRVLLRRGREVGQEKSLDLIGPFPNSQEIKTGLKIMRRLFPFRDTCTPLSDKPCFNAQISLCPGVCAGLISRPAYLKQIKKLRLFLHGQKKQLLRLLEKDMNTLAAAQEFEAADKIKRQIFTLQHIQDVALITGENKREFAGVNFRIEAYDVAHLAGGLAVGAMTVWQNGDQRPDLYRRFRLRATKPGDDYAGLCEILTRRLNHPEWPFPNLIAVDGGQTQLNLAKKIISENGLAIPVLAVTKDERHRPREIKGDQKLARAHEAAIITANAEAHRFALAYHRRLRRL